MGKKLLLKIKESVWIIPSIYCVISFFIAILIVYIDSSLHEYVHKYLPDFLMTSVDLAQTTLGTIAGALLTMTTITFSTIMVVLTTYTSQFSPRTLKDFLTDPSTMRVLGVFLGGFIYSIVSLLFMRNTTIDHEVISATVGVLVAFVCIAFFAYFIHNVATSIQVNNLINKLAADTLQTIKDDRKALKNSTMHEVDKQPQIPTEYSQKRDITGEHFGYIQLIDYQGLYQLAKDKNYLIEVNQYIGHYVTSESKLLTIYHHGNNIKFRISDYVTIGDDRTSLQDVEFNLIKMVEIALRAISPGINDPNTAIDCIRFLRVPLLEALSGRGRFSVYNDNEKKLRLIKRKESPEQLLYTTFYQLSHYGREDISILLAILDTLIHIAKNSSDNIKHEIKAFAIYVIRKFQKERIEELDRKQLKHKQTELETFVGPIGLSP